MTSPAHARPTPSPAPTSPPLPALPGQPGEPASPALGFATALVRAWTNAYTWRLEPAVRDRRRAEIESELWEFQNDPERGSHPAAHMLARLLIGIHDDLSWRAENAPARRIRHRSRLRAVAAWTVATIFIVAALLILPLMTTATLPPLPDKPRVAIRVAEPPPPPPPPPCAPPGFPQHRPCTS